MHHARRHCTGTVTTEVMQIYTHMPTNIRICLHMHVHVQEASMETSMKEISSFITSYYYRIPT